MEGVDHVHIVQVGGGGLIGQVHGMLQGDVPDGEGLELGVTGVDAALMLVVELAQAGGHLAAAGAGGGDHHQRTGGLDVVVDAEALVGDDVGHVMGVTGDGIMAVSLHAQGIQPLQEGIGGRLAGVPGQHHAAHIKLQLPEGVDEAQHVHIIGDAQVAPDLVALDVGGVDGDDHLHVVLELLKHPHLAVRLEARQHPGCMVVVKELAAELQVQLAAELGDPLADLGGLGGQIFLVVKTDLRHILLLP